MLICRCTLWAWPLGGRGRPSRRALGRRTLGAADPLPELVHVGLGLCSGLARGHAPLRMEVEDSGGVVLTAYHSHARSQPQGAEPRCASRASHPLSRYGAAPRAARARAGRGGEGAALRQVFMELITETALCMILIGDEKQPGQKVCVWLAEASGVLVVLTQLYQELDKHTISVEDSHHVLEKF